MLQQRRFILWSMFCLILLSSYLAANDTDQIYLSRHIWGDKIYRDDFKGRVVVLLLWYYDEATCKALCSNLAGYARRYQREGWVFLSIHTIKGPNGQIPNLGDIWKSARSQRLPFPIFFGNLGTLDQKVKYAPALLIFDTSGKLVYFYQDDKRQNPNEGFKKMRELLKGPHWLLGNRNFKYLDRQARAIKYALRDNRNLASIYKDLAKKKTSKKGKEKEEAIYLITQLNEYLQEQKKKMHRLSKTEPEEYWKVFKNFIDSSEVWT